MSGCSIETRLQWAGQHRSGWNMPQEGSPNRIAADGRVFEDDTTFWDDIEGYCGALSYRHGEDLAVHVSSKHDRYDLRIERWGAVRDLVYSETGLTSQFYAVPPDADANGCGWPTALSVPIPTEWRSGFYLVTLTASGAAAHHDTAHAGFVVRPSQDGRTSNGLLVLATNTWNAYNTWGGASLYTGGSRVSYRRPFGRGMLCRPEVDRDDRKARPTRWGEDPDIEGDRFQRYRLANAYPAAIGSSGWFDRERRFVEWAEGIGYEFDYAVSTDLEVSGALDGYDLVLGVGHDEYWSAEQRTAVEVHVERGGDYASFSGNTMFWQVRVAEADGPASMVCHKYTAHEHDPILATDPTKMTGMWADPMVGRPEASFLGGGSAWGLYSRFGQATPRGSGAFTVYRHDHWLFEGTGLRYGDLLGAKHGVVGYETLGCRIQFDEYQLPIPAGGDHAPADLEIAAFTPSSNIGVGEYPASISALDDQGDLEFIAARIHGRVDAETLARARYGNAIMAVGRPKGTTGGEVVVIGTTDWVFGLADDPAVARVTCNVLDRFDLSRVPMAPVA